MELEARWGRRKAEVRVWSRHMLFRYRYLIYFDDELYFKLKSYVGGFALSSHLDKRLPQALFALGPSRVVLFIL